ncbi:MAG: tetratricopeptide repeat protein [Candidatus Melainabacteria bacterium]|nr:MAG: tetratricopeptide repeat protein [Candidatus Melainabacteria bacterium]
MFYLGALYTKTNDFQKAYDFYIKLKKIRPEYENLYRNLALVCFRLDKIDETIEYSQKALEFNELDNIAYNTLALMYILKNERNSAIEVLEKAIALNIVDAQIYKNLGKLYIMSNKLDDAILLLNKLVEIEPDNKEGLMSLAQIYQIKDDFQKAYEFLKIASNYYFDVKNSSTYAYCAMQAGDYDEAINIYNILMKSDNKNPVLKINLANCYIKTSAYDLALPLLSELAKSNPQSIQIAQQLSLCHRSMGNLELAKDALKAVIHKKQENADVFTTMLFFYIKQVKQAKPLKCSKRL